MKHVKITYETNNVDDSFILIKYAKANESDTKSESQSKLDSTPYLNALIKKFMEIMNSNIGAKTDVNYHIEKVTNYTIRIPVHVYTNDESKLNECELIDKRVKTIRNFFENYNWNSASKVELWLVRSLYTLNFNISDSFIIETETKNHDYKPVKDILFIKYPNIQFPTIKKTILLDESEITTLVDPYVQDFGLFLNLSITFDEMGMSYNALHLYEHLLTKPWANLSGIDILELNGSTYPTGVCFVYTIHRNMESLKQYTNATLKWLFESRNQEFWNKISDDIKLETSRTISETRLERTLVSMGRSDFKAYNNNYDLNIFRYWANKPFNILLVSNVEIKDLNREHLNDIVRKYPLNKIERPPNIKFKHIPIDVLKMKQLTGYYILKQNYEEVKRLFMEQNFDTKSFYGIDCILTTDKEDLSVYNSILHPLLFLNKYYHEDELQDFVKTHVIPYSARFYNITNVQLKHVSSYINEID